MTDLDEDLGIELEAVVRTFLAETAEGLTAMEEALVALESRPEDDELLGSIFRVAHTLKGNSASLGFARMAEFAHCLEDLLDGLRGRTLPLTSSLITLLLQATDALREMVPAAAAGSDEMTAAHKKVLRQLSKKLPASGPPGRRTPERHRSPARAETHGAPREGRERVSSLRVDIDKLDGMLNLTGEIAVARGRLRQLLESLPAHAVEEVLEVQREVDRLSADLQELVMKARMVAVGPVFRAQIRTLRDAAAARGKLARLVLEGEDVEVDTRVIEHLRDPLIHMIRNAVDHGIEPPEVRSARGKDPCGTLLLRARHHAGGIEIQVRDDGAGLSRERIAERARSRGLAATPEKLTDSELLRLVLEPGFSTTQEVTELSGRGVGMDVVRRNVGELRGSLTIESREGEGACFTIRLPLTLAIIEGFGVGVGDQTYVIPMDAVLECVALADDERPGAGASGIISLRGQPLPCLRLRDVFGVDAEGAGPARENVVVVQHGDSRAALAVDVLHGESQTVIKPLGPLFHRLPGIAGSAILGNGRVALILDMPVLFQRIGGASAGADARRPS